MSLQAAVATPTRQLPDFRNTVVIYRDRTPFYEDPNYLEKTTNDFHQKKLLDVSYTFNTEYKITRIVKFIFSIIIFPIGLYNLLHSLVGKIILPASTPSLMNQPSDCFDNSRTEISLNGEWKYKRLTIAVDGYEFDALIMCKPSTYKNKRWMIYSGGNGEFYENTAQRNETQEMLKSLNSNALFLNYPSVGASSGLPSREACSKAYKAALSYLEDATYGMGAKEIIGYGHSIGVGVQAEAIASHVFREKVKYVFVKSRSFSDLCTTTYCITRSRILAFLVKFFGWNIDSLKSSEKLPVKEIILQTATVREYTELHDSSLIINDGIIHKDASLAKALLDKNIVHNKKFIGIPDDHNHPLTNRAYIVNLIKEALKN
jgi:hypothetical protein